MKFLIVLAALIAVACAVPYGVGVPLLAHAPVTSVTSRLDTYGAKVIAPVAVAAPVVHGVGYGYGLGAPLVGYGGYGLAYNNGLYGHGLGYGSKIYG